MSNSDHMLHAELLARIASQKQADDELWDMCVGRTVRIISDYNGQPFGKSKPNLKGREFKVKAAFFHAKSITLWLEAGDYRTHAIGLKDVQFLEAL